jgi:hypothetical protein
MEPIKFSREQISLAVGDATAILVAVALGFVNHANISGFLDRFAFTFLPFTIAWFISAPRFGLFDLSSSAWKKLALQISAAMFLAAPLAVIFRAAWLQSSALPLFTLIMGASTAIALFVWRFIYLFWLARN